MSIQEKSYKELRKALERAKRYRTVIEIITAATPPAGRPPNIRGRVKKVEDGTFVLELLSGPDRFGIYSIAQLIGFVPASQESEEEEEEESEEEEEEESEEAKY
ncbi:hypothetical protein ACQCT5_01040 [Sutcliffiella halmapala]